MPRGFNGFDEEWLNRYRKGSSGGTATPAPVPDAKRSTQTGRHRDRNPKINKTEAEYLNILRSRLRAGEILEILQHESIKFRVGAHRCWYSPDFPVIGPEGLELHEVKGAFVRDDARCKFQSAKLMYPQFKWVWAQKTKEGWQIA